MLLDSTLTLRTEADMLRLDLRERKPMKSKTSAGIKCEYSSHQKNENGKSLARMRMKMQSHETKAPTRPGHHLNNVGN